MIWLSIVTAVIVTMRLLVWLLCFQFNNNHPHNRVWAILVRGKLSLNASARLDEFLQPNIFFVCCSISTVLWGELEWSSYFPHNVTVSVMSDLFGGFLGKVWAGYWFPIDWIVVQCEVYDTIVVHYTGLGKSVTTPLLVVYFWKWEAGHTFLV